MNCQPCRAYESKWFGSLPVFFLKFTNGALKFCHWKLWYAYWIVFGDAGFWNVFNVSNDRSFLRYASLGHEPYLSTLAILKMSVLRKVEHLFKFLDWISNGFWVPQQIVVLAEVLFGHLDPANFNQVIDAFKKMEVTVLVMDQFGCGITCMRTWRGELSGIVPKWWEMRDDESSWILGQSRWNM